MPEISRFFGIVIRIHTGDHNPPHFHAQYGETEGVIRIRDLKIVAGRLSPRALHLVKTWAATHQEQLLTAWERAQRSESPGKIPPLD